MNPCILITSHLNNGRKREVCKELLGFLKQFNLPIIHLGNYSIPEDLQAQTDYTIFMEDNPKIDRTINVWRSLPEDIGLGPNLKGWTIVPDHGAAHTLSHLRGFLFASSLGYDYVYAINYDVKIAKLDMLEMIKQSTNYKPTCFIDKHIANPEEGMSMNLFSISTNEYIEMCQSHLPYYLENNLPSNDFYPEKFTRWMWDNANITDKAFTDLKFDHTESNFTTKGLYGECLPYFYKNQIILFFTEKQNSTPVIKVNDNLISVKSLNDQFYTIENIEGEHFIKNNYGEFELRFNNTQDFRNNNYIT